MIFPPSVQSLIGREVSSYYFLQPFRATLICVCILIGQKRLCYYLHWQFICKLDMLLLWANCCITIRTEWHNFAQLPVFGSGVIGQYFVRKRSHYCVDFLLYKSASLIIGCKPYDNVSRTIPMYFKSDCLIVLTSFYLSQVFVQEQLRHGRATTWLMKNVEGAPPPR